MPWELKITDPTTCPWAICKRSRTLSAKEFRQSSSTEARVDLRNCRNQKSSFPTYSWRAMEKMPARVQGDYEDGELFLGCFLELNRRLRKWTLRFVAAGIRCR